MVLLIVNSLLSLCYYLPAINKIIFSRDISEKANKAEGIAPSISIPIVIMVIFTVVLGVYPQLGLKVVNPVVDFLMASMGAR